MRVKKAARKLTNANEIVTSDEKIARLLGLLAIKEVEQRDEQVRLLRSAGFQVAEVAAMLSITEHHVAVATHRGRKKKPVKKAVTKNR